LGGTGLGGLWALAYAWKTRVTILRCVFSIFDSSQDIPLHVYEFLKFVGVTVGMATAGKLLFGSMDWY